MAINIFLFTNFKMNSFRNVTPSPSELDIEFDTESSNESSLGYLDIDEDDAIDPDAVDLINIREQINLLVSEEQLPGEDDDDKTSQYFPPTNLVIRLNHHISPDAVTFLAKKLMASKNSGGAELLVRCEPFSGAGEEVGSRFIGKLN